MCMYGYYGLLGLLPTSGENFKSTGPLEIYLLRKMMTFNTYFTRCVCVCVCVCVSACRVNNSSVNKTAYRCYDHLGMVRCMFKGFPNTCINFLF